MSRSNPRNPRAPEGPRGSALHACRAGEHHRVRPGEERRLHRHVHAVRSDAVDELAVSAPDHAERQATSPSCSSRAPGSTWCRSRPSTRRTPNPTWFGESIAQWDGDTLVVDTIGFNGFTRLDTKGDPHSDQLHLVQTFTHDRRGHIAYTVTVDDPVYYTKPWTNERTFTLTNDHLLEYSCEENNRSLWEGRIKIWVPPGSEQPRIQKSDNLQTARGSSPTNRCRKSSPPSAFPSPSRHIFLCAEQTKPKCCDYERGVAAWDFLKKRLKELGLSEQGGVLRTQGQLPAHLRGRPDCRRLPGRHLVPGVRSARARAHHPGAPDRRPPGSGLVVRRKETHGVAALPIEPSTRR